MSSQPSSRRRLVMAPFVRQLPATGRLRGACAAAAWRARVGFALSASALALPLAIKLSCPFKGALGRDWVFATKPITKQHPASAVFGLSSQESLKTGNRSGAVAVYEQHGSFERVWLQTRVKKLCRAETLDCLSRLRRPGLEQHDSLSLETVVIPADYQPSNDCGSQQRKQEPRPVRRLC